MAVTVSRATLWTNDTPNTPGTLAETLKPLAEGKTNLDLVMGYSHPDKTGATIEVFPVVSQTARKAARTSGFSKSAFPCVSVTGPNHVGLGREIAAALAEAGINLNFVVAQVIGQQFAGMFSFEANSEADLAVKIIRQAIRHAPGTAKRKTRRATAARTPGKTAKKKRSVARKTTKKRRAKKH